MTQRRLHVDRIWWRNVPLGEFYNIERHPRIDGGGGALYFEIPNSLVPATLDFLGVTYIDLPVTIQVGVIGQPGLGTSPLEFHRKEGDRMRIARQNRRQPKSQRHPAWTDKQGFPIAPDNITNRENALPHFPAGGLRIYVVKTVEGNYYAGFKQGSRPEDMKQNDPAWDLYSQGRVPGGVISGKKARDD